jgi:hypothetical protein
MDQVEKPIKDDLPVNLAKTLVRWIRKAKKKKLTSSGQLHSDDSQDCLCESSEDKAACNIKTCDNTGGESY